MAPWCSGLTYWPVKPEIAGSNPVGVANLPSLAWVNASSRLDSSSSISTSLDCLFNRLSFSSCRARSLRISPIG